MNTTLEFLTTPDISRLDVPRIVLFDDDPFFVRMMEHYAKRNFMSLMGVWRMDDILGKAIQVYGDHHATH